MNVTCSSHARHIVQFVQDMLTSIYTSSAIEAFDWLKWVFTSKTIVIHVNLVKPFLNKPYASNFGFWVIFSWTINDGFHVDYNQLKWHDGLSNFLKYSSICSWWHFLALKYCNIVMKTHEITHLLEKTWLRSRRWQPPLLSQHNSNWQTWLWLHE